MVEQTRVPHTVGRIRCIADGWVKDLIGEFDVSVVDDVETINH